MKEEPPSLPFELQAATYLAKDSLFKLLLITEAAVWSSDDGSAVPNIRSSPKMDVTEWQNLAKASHRRAPRGLAKSAVSKTAYLSVW